MKFSMVITGGDAVKRALEKASDAVERNLVKNVREITLAVHKQAIVEIQKNTDGIRQKRYGPERFVNVSRPGQPPNTDTGTLVKSIQFDFRYEAGRIEGSVGTNLKYGAWLEFGTLHMAARPWLGPAFVNQQKFYVDRFKDDVKKAVREVAKQRKARAQGGT